MTWILLGFFSQYHLVRWVGLSTERNFFSLVFNQKNSFLSFREANPKMKNVRNGFNWLACGAFWTIIAVHLWLFRCYLVLYPWKNAFSMMCWKNKLFCLISYKTVDKLKNNAVNCNKKKQVFGMNIIWNFLLARVRRVSW